MKSGIYKITNTTNGKFYIGSSKNIQERWDNHKQHLRGGYHVNPKFQHAWDFYGEVKFQFDVIEEVEPNEILLLEREQYHLDLWKPHHRTVGYNICPKASGGDNITHNPNRDAFIEKMKIINHGEGNGMFGKNHSEDTIVMMKTKSIGRYTLDWFVKKYGKVEGEEKFQARRMMLKNRKNINYVTDPDASYMSFKGKKHKQDFKSKSNASKTYFKNHWNEFVKLVKSGKYSQRQLSTMLGISRMALKVRMREILK